MAIKSFSNVRPGDLGGWVESLDNLSQDGNIHINANITIWEGDIESVEDIYLFNDHLGAQDFIYYLSDRYYIGETGYNRGAFIMSGLETSEKCSKYCGYS